MCPVGQGLKSLIDDLNLGMLGSFACFLSSADFYFKIIIYNLKNLTIGVSSRLDLDQARHFVGPDLGPNCLQMLSADATR